MKHDQLRKEAARYMIYSCIHLYIRKLNKISTSVRLFTFLYGYCRKRAVEETRKKEDMKHKEEVNSRQKLVFKEMSLVEQEPPPTVKQEEVIEEEEVPKVKERREPKHKKK